LPITAGRIHFLRPVQPHGTVRILNEHGRVPKRLADHYLWATLTTHRQTLDLWFRRDLTHAWRLIPHAPYFLAEPVLKRPPLCAKLFTMS
jgi:hypothetical protein